jgi:hypothetical protein
MIETSNTQELQQIAYRRTEQMMTKCRIDKTRLTFCYE